MTRVVAIDGPAGSGKSTVARGVAARLGLEVLDTGAMYRAVTLGVLRAGVDPAASEPDTLVELARSLRIEVDDRVLLDGEDVTDAVRGPEVTASVSTVSAVPAVRVELVERQRGWVEARGGGVVEGRDIGTVVFPEAPVKVFLTASDAVRAARRRAEELAAQRPSEVEAIRAAIERRDRLDSSRAVAPLRAADDAVVVDTSELAVQDVVERVLDEVDRAGLMR